MTATHELTAAFDDSECFNWAVDEAWNLHRVKSKAALLIDLLRGAFLPQQAEEALHDLAHLIAEDNTRKTNISPDAGYPAGPDVEF